MQRVATRARSISPPNVNVTNIVTGGARSISPFQPVQMVKSGVGAGAGSVRPSVIRPMPTALQVSKVTSDAVAQYSQENTALRNACTTMISQALKSAQQALDAQTKAYQELTQDMLKRYQQLQTNCGSTMQDVSTILQQQLRSEQQVANIVYNANKLIRQTNKALDWIKENGDELQTKLVGSFEQIQKEIDAIMKQHETKSRE